MKKLNFLLVFDALKTLIEQSNTTLINDFDSFSFLFRLKLPNI
jgi:hypothetical protein